MQLDMQHCMWIYCIPGTTKCKMSCKILHPYGALSSSNLSSAKFLAHTPSSTKKPSLIVQLLSGCKLFWDWGGVVTLVAYERNICKLQYYICKVYMLKRPLIFQHCRRVYYLLYSRYHGQHCGLCVWG